MAETVVFVDTGLSRVTGGRFQSRIGREEIGAQLVASCCQAIGWNIRFLRPDSDQPDIVYDMINEESYDVIVFFPYTHTKWLADEVAQLFKDKVPIVYGGYHAGVGVNAKKVLAEGVADYVISGRGDNALPWLLQKLSIRQVPSRVIRGQTAIPFDGLPWPIRDENLMQDLHDEPLPFKPPAHLEPNPRKCVIVAGAIGCSSRCDFCSSWIICPKVFHRSPKSVVDEMMWLNREYGPGLVYHFANPLFNADRDWVMALCAEMEKRGPFPSICMPDFNLDRAMVQAMKRAGFYFVMLGLEFVSDQLRTTRGKRPGNPATTYQLCAEVGILTRAFFMLGRLGMTRQELEAELEALESFPFRADQLRINFEVPFPGTKISRKITPENVIADYPHYTTEEPVYRTGLSQEEWQEARRQINYNYHFGERQEVHYERQIKKFPELKEVYQDFLSRLGQSLRN